MTKLANTCRFVIVNYRINNSKFPTTWYLYTSKRHAVNKFFQDIQMGIVRVVNGALWSTKIIKSVSLIE